LPSRANVNDWLHAFCLLSANSNTQDNNKPAANIIVPGDLTELKEIHDI